MKEDKKDVKEIKKCITSDWVLVDSQGGIIAQENFFKVVEEGLLSHSTIEWITQIKVSFSVIVFIYFYLKFLMAKY